MHAKQIERISRQIEILQGQVLALLDNPTPFNKAKAQRLAEGIRNRCDMITALMNHGLYEGTRIVNEWDR